MVIGTARVELHIPAAQSLKDKRAVMKSVIARIQNKFGVAVAEVEEHDRWQVGVIGIACVSTDTRHADSVIATAVAAVASLATDAEVIDIQTEIVHVL